AGWDWSMGSSFERGERDLAAWASSDRQNLAKLRTLAPELARALAGLFGADAPGAYPPWVQVRATTADRLPLAGPVPQWAQWASLPSGGAAPTLDTLPRQPGLYVLAGLGARGLSLAALCAELIACQIEGEPWPLEAGLAQALDPARFALKRLRRPGG
ncbi:MAG: bifunctional tRNA (5-methylaminomethyl-2-thiouridine)(34)-methyltransferase MnmD/FAD-dependent 5-carboxymethylaminomethyl-2-thiouridine(34) oxidoreductase MnmC, partial [Comamonas sp.]